MSVDVQLFAQHLEWAEDRRRKPYRDSVGKLTIGIGRNLDDRGLRDVEIDFMRDNDIVEVLGECAALPYWWMLDDVRQLVVADLVFNLGMTKWLGFDQANKALLRGDYARAADELQYRDGLTKTELSPWYRQTKRRAVKLVEAMRTGVWTPERS